MNLIDLATLLIPQPQVAVEKDTYRVHPFPRMYALSKKGSIRVYDIKVEDLGDHAVLTTRKKATLNGKWTEDVYEYWEGVNIGKSNETTYLEQALSEAKSLWNKLKDAGFTIIIPKDKFNTDASGNMKPMLAVHFNEKRIKFPCLIQPKYDGVRCLLFENEQGIQVISRKGKPYNIPHLKKWAEEHRDLLPLDGELYNHKDLTFQEIVSAVKRLSPITSQIRYVIYDKPIENLSNKERYDLLSMAFVFPDSLDYPVYLAPTFVCTNMKELWKYHKKFVDEGYEGAIIRNYEGKYEFGFRSNDLIKVKTFDDAEFKIVDVVEATGRDSGTAIFVCECEGGHFNVKPQGTRELRAEYLRNREVLFGKMVTVQYQGLSDGGIPRFPSAISIRDYE